MPETVTPTLEESANKIAAYLAETIPKAGDFVMAEAPDVVRQVVALDLYRALFWSGSCLLLFLVCGTAAVICARKCSRHQWGERTAGWGIGFISCVVCCLFVLPHVFLNAHNALGPAFAPKAHLLERIGVLK